MLVTPPQNCTPRHGVLQRHTVPADESERPMTSEAPETGFLALQTPTGTQRPTPADRAADAVQRVSVARPHGRETVRGISPRPADNTICGQNDVDTTTYAVRQLLQHGAG